MESGYRTAGDGDEQSREQAAVTYLKTVKCIQLHIGMSHNHTKYGTDDHTQQHKGGHVISGLHQKPHGHYGCQEQVCHDDVDPYGLGSIDRKLHTYRKHHYQQTDGYDCLDPFVHFSNLFLDQTEDHSDQDEQHGNGCCTAVSICHTCIFQSGTYESTCHHIGKGCDN